MIPAIRPVIRRRALVEQLVQVMAEVPQQSVVLPLRALTRLPRVIGELLKVLSDWKRHSETRLQV